MALTASPVQGHARVFNVCSLNHPPLLLPSIYMSPLFLKISVSSAMWWKYENISETDIMKFDNTRVWVSGFLRVFRAWVLRL